MKIALSIVAAYAAWFVAFFVIYPPHAHCYPKADTMLCGMTWESEHD